MMVRVRGVVSAAANGCRESRGARSVVSVAKLFTSFLVGR